MFRIGDFSQLAQVSVRTLRLYDELGLIKPAQVDRLSGYRYYTAEQLPRLNRILALKDLGFSLEQITQLLSDDLPLERLRGMMMMKHADLQRQLEEGQTRLTRVEARLKQIEREGKLSGYEVVLKEVQPMTIASGSWLVPSLDEMVRIRCNLFGDIYDELARNRIEPGTPELALYPNCEYTEEDIQLEAAVAVEASLLKSPAAGRLLDEKIILRELPAVPMMASVVHHGRFQDVVDAITALYRWVGENGYVAEGAYREIHLFGRENELHDFNSVTLEMQLPIAPR